MQPENVGYLASGNTGNPVLDEISTAHANLSPQAQQAIEGAHGILGISPSHSDPTLAATTAPSPELAVPGVSGPRGPLPNLSPEVPAPTALMAAMGGTPMADVNPSGSGVDTGLLDRSVDSGDQSIPIPATPSSISLPGESELARLRTNGPGVNSIRNPVARGFAKVGDVLGSTFARGLASNIPGTTAHNLQLQDRAEKEATDERASAKNVADVAKTNADVPLEGAQTNEANARADSLRNPPAKVHDEEFFRAGDGSYIGYRDAAGRIYGPNDPDIPPAVKQVLEAGKAKPTKNTTPYEDWRDDPKNKGKDPIEFIKAEAAAKPLTEAAKPLQGVDQMNKILESRWQVLHPGEKLPEHFVIPQNATEKDYDRIDKALESTERAFGTKAQQDQVNEMRKQTLALAQKKDDRAAARDPNTEKEYKSVHDDLNKKFATTETQLQNADQAIAEINSGAMGQAFGTIKSLVALAGGQGSGVRITQAELNSIAKARGIKGDLEGWFNSLAGEGKLSGEQVQQLNSVLSDVKRKGEEKRALLSSTLDKLAAAKDTKEIRAIEKEYRDSGAGGSESAKKVGTQAEYDALPKGAKYIDANGVPGTKK